MPDPVIARPDSSEIPEYFRQYVRLVPEGDILELLERQGAQTVAMVSGLNEDQALYRYAPEKWSVKQVIGHLSDTERVFTYRALRFSRGDATALPGFDENDFVAGANFDERPLRDVLDEFGSVRAASLTFYRSLNAELARRRGVANELRFTVGSIPYVVAGHERHHARVLSERYLAAM
ncbi:MAG: DinB family protein [Gemmatimonadota bacterium]|nr:MAG: DinB family protein [Gemmatimonadota bacterium]